MLPGPRALRVSRLAIFGFALSLSLLACARAEVPLMTLTPATTPPVRTLSPGLAAPAATRKPTVAPLAEPTVPATAPLPPQPTDTPPATLEPPAVREEQVVPLPPSAPTVAVAAEEATAPRLIIPALALDQEVVTVPAVNGQWDVSALQQRIGWLETTGQKPGDRLAMVFIAHRTISFSTMGPFAKLWTLHVGEEVTYRADGTDYVYRVKYQMEVEPDEIWRLYMEDKHRLLLVTCAEWDYAAWKYGKRLIVVTEAAEERPAP